MTDKNSPARHQAEPQWVKAGQSTTSHTDYTKRAKIQVDVEPGYWLHVDADRDGKVDGDIYTGKWESGEKKKGAILLVNCDADGDPEAAEFLKPLIPWGPRRKDNDDQKINGTEDLEDFAPLVIRRTVEQVSEKWQGFLHIKENSECIRIFLKITGMTRAGMKADYVQVLGKGCEEKYRLPHLHFNQLEFFMEAVNYPSYQFDGLIPLELTIQENGSKIFGHEISVRVAPWVMFHGLNPTKKIFVAEVRDNKKFVEDLERELKLVGIPKAMRFSNRGNHDGWVQDIMEIGHSVLPGKPELPVILRTPWNRPGGDSLQDWPRNGLLAPGMGFTEVAPPNKHGSSLDSFGNLECSPPVVVNGRKYKFGRIVYGRNHASSINPNLVRFLNSQRVQHPFSIDTGWLEVGHVDEVLSFCPMRDAAKKFRVLLVSPRLAMEIVGRLIREGHGKEEFFSQVPSSDWNMVRKKGGRYHKLRSPSDMQANRKFKGMQNYAQSCVDEIKESLMIKLGLDEEDFIEIPVLFHEAKEGFPRALAYIPNAVNMLVLTRPDQSAHLVIPKPHGPVIKGKCVFETEITARLQKFKGSGLSFNYMDDFAEYHARQGDIHCATNSLREASRTQFWWEQEME